MNETFEQRRDRLAEEFSYSQFVYHSSEPNFLAKRGRYDGFKAGYDACREQMQSELQGKLHAFTHAMNIKAIELQETIYAEKDKVRALNTLLDETSASRDKLHFEMEAEKAKSQRLLEILKTVTPYAANYNLLKHAFESDAVISAREAIAEYEAGGG